MSKRREWKGTKKRPRTEKEHEERRKWEAMSPEEKRSRQRKQLIGFLEMFQGEAPVCFINNKPQPHNPMSKEEADLHLALFDKEVEPSDEIRMLLAQLELARWPKSKKQLFKFWKLAFPEFFARDT